MATVSTLSLPGPLRAAAADAGRVVCAAGGRLTAYAPTGSPLWDTPEPGGLLALATAGDMLVAAIEPGVVVWLDPGSGAERMRLPLGGEPVVSSGGGGVWAFDLHSQRAWQLVDGGGMAPPITLAGADGVAADGERLWWTSREDTLLREGARSVDLEVGAGERGGMTVCAGSVWVSVGDGLLRVGAWGAELGPRLAAPEGPVPFLACADGILVGASGRRGLFVLDPSSDAEVRHLDVDLGGELDALVTTRDVVWAFPAGRPEARLVAVRPPG